MSRFLQRNLPGLFPFASYKEKKKNHYLKELAAMIGNKLILFVLFSLVMSLFPSQMVYAVPRTIQLSVSGCDT